MTDIAHTVVSLVQQYGFVALFVYMVLETAFILHFAPSEVVVPVAAAVLVHGPITFVAFVLDATLGATVGAVLLYTIFARYGIEAVGRYGRYFHVSESDLDRSQRWFRRWGETATLWGRLLPLVRAIISIPAGLAAMNFRRFVAYSAVGALVFNTVLTYLVYAGRTVESPVRLVLETVVFGAVGEYVIAHRWRLALQSGLALAVVAVVWWKRTWIRESPNRAKAVAVRTVFWTGGVSGLALVVAGVSMPQRAFPAVMWFWDDPGTLVEIGLSKGAALVVTGATVVMVAAVLLALADRFRIETRERGFAVFWK